MQSSCKSSAEHARIVAKVLPYAIVLYCIQVFIWRPSTAMGKQRRFWFD